MSRAPNALLRWGRFLAVTRSSFRPVEVAGLDAQRERVREVTHDALLDLDFHPARAGAPNRS